MHKVYIIFLLVVFRILPSFSQIIEDNLSVQFKNFNLEVLKTSMTEIESRFKDDSLIYVEYEGTYILKNGKLDLFVCDKDADDVLDLIRLFASNYQTWNNIKIGLDYKSVKDKFPEGDLGVNWDLANYIVYSIRIHGQEIDMSFYFDVGTDEAIPEMKQNELEDILFSHSILTMIEINNPN